MGWSSRRICIVAIMLLAIVLTGCKTNKLQGIEGKWVLDNNTMMIIQKDGFYWFQDYQNNDKNYFFGKDVTILSGEDALNAIGVPDENRETLLKTHTYYLSVTYSQYNVDGKDNSQMLDGQLSEFAIQMDQKDHLIIINLLNNEQYLARRYL